MDDVPCLVHQDETRPYDTVLREIVKLGFPCAKIEQTSVGGWKVVDLGDRNPMAIGCSCSMTGEGEVYKECSTCGTIAFRLQMFKKGYV
jgi:hypothetical protein